VIWLFAFAVGMLIVTPQDDRAQKFTLGECGASGVRDLVISCADYRCSHSTRISAEQ
jgi:hypothetical protein